MTWLPERAKVKHVMTMSTRRTEVGTVGEKVLFKMRRGRKKS